MKKLDHPNVVHLFEVLDVSSDDELYMVVEMCSKGVVMKVGYGTEAEPYSEEQCRLWFRDLILGIEYRTCNRICAGKMSLILALSSCTGHHTPRHQARQPSFDR